MTVSANNNVPLIAVSQNIIRDTHDTECDALDARWGLLLAAAGLHWILLPNHPQQAGQLLDRVVPQGLLLTGGGSLVKYGGTSHRRDATEKVALEWALAGGVPVLGVCRGMQFIADYFGAKLEPVDGHVRTTHTIRFAEKERSVNSYHALGVRELAHPLLSEAKACDGVVEALRHSDLPVAGIMWHPERMSSFEEEDLILVRHCFLKPRA